MLCARVPICASQEYGMNTSAKRGAPLSQPADPLFCNASGGGEALEWGRFLSDQMEWIGGRTLLVDNELERHVLKLVPLRFPRLKKLHVEDHA